MMSGFLGTVIAIERAVAVKLPAAFVAPFASALGALAMLAGHATVGAWLSALGALVFVGVNVVVVLRQSASHTVLMLVGALAWLIGNLMLATGLGAPFTLAWWYAFLVLTIAAERLEMTRLTRRHPLAEGALIAILLALLGGAALSPPQPLLGGVLYGSALIVLAAWLAAFDIARHTVRAQGLSRYMAICLLSGYAWLAVAGIAWVGMAFGCPGRDMALHALGLGFILSMVMGHAPVILPAVARVKLLFGAWFYVPLALLHGSLLLRLFAGFSDPALRTLGAALNAVSLAVFMITVLGSALAWKLRHRTP
ncbi:MAG TPA: hypothetical protein VFL86_02545, partial [Burkholderiaceae bacterium]|nr:hypothetical protein [Burkholderiaceae bacterium]